MGNKEEQAIAEQQSIEEKMASNETFRIQVKLSGMQAGSLEHAGGAARA